MPPLRGGPPPLWPVASFDDDPDLPADDDIHLVAWLALAAEHLLIRVDALAGDGRHLLDLEWGEISEQRHPSQEDDPLHQRDCWQSIHRHSSRNLFFSMTSGARAQR